MLVLSSQLTVRGQFLSKGGRCVERPLCLLLTRYQYGRGAVELKLEGSIGD